jgi:NAD(P)-dependent dehydrogenase (short-subunit alcohol dehydrogenase family)
MHAEDRPRSERSKKWSRDGFDAQMQGNLLSPYLLTQLLMPALTAAAETAGTARIVNCTGGGLPMLRSELHRDAFEQVVVEDGDTSLYSCHRLRQSQSKKGRVVFTLGLRARPPPRTPPVSVHAMRCGW